MGQCSRYSVVLCRINGYYARGWPVNAAENLKINCTLSGDSAIDFERLSLMFKVPSVATGKQEQQATMIRALLLSFDATVRKFSDETGKRYPSLEEVLKWSGCSAQDIKLLYPNSPAAGVDAVKSAITRKNEHKQSP
jgi:hypothetical protein